jgi:hypothetical protein
MKAARYALLGLAILAQACGGDRALVLIDVTGAEGLPPIHHIVVQLRGGATTTAEESFTGDIPHAAPPLQVGIYTKDGMEGEITVVVSAQDAAGCERGHGEGKLKVSLGDIGRVSVLVSSTPVTCPGDGGVEGGVAPTTDGPVMAAPDAGAPADARADGAGMGVPDAGVDRAPDASADATPAGADDAGSDATDATLVIPMPDMAIISVPDAAPPVDAASPDAPSPDLAEPDAAVPDAPVDMAEPDAAVDMAEPDAAVDMAEPDAPPPDVSPDLEPDAAEPDAAEPDAAPPDLEPDAAPPDIEPDAMEPDVDPDA